MHVTIVVFKFSSTHYISYYTCISSSRDPKALLGPLDSQVLMAIWVLMAPLVPPDLQDPLVLRDVRAQKVSLDLLELMERG